MDEPRFRLVTSAGDGILEARFEFLGGTPLRIQVAMRGLDNAGVARKGDGVDLGLVDSDIRFAIYDVNRIDRTSVDADYVMGIASGNLYILAIHWPSSTKPGGYDACGFSVRRTNEGVFEMVSLESSPLILAIERGSEERVPLGRIEESELTDIADSTPTPSLGCEVERPSSYFTELTVAGYRGFATLNTLRFAVPDSEAAGSGLTIIIGANNSGKSTFLEALHYVARARDTTMHSFPQPRRNHLLDSVSIVLRREDGVSLAVESLRKGGSQAASSWSPSGVPGTRFDLHITPARRVFNPYFGQHGSEDRDWGQRESEFSRTQPRDNFTARLQAVDREPTRRADFDALLTEIVGEPLDWTIDEIAAGQQFIKLNGSGAWHTSEGLGEGLISLLFIVDALYDSKPGALIAIDEPETSLHPQLIKRLRKVLSRFAADRQIVIATHSPLLIDWQDVANGATVARVFKSKDDGESYIAQAATLTLRDVARLADFRNLPNPHTVGTVAREAFFLEDGVILTEGQDDVAYMPRVLNDLGLDATGNLFGWGSGGAHNTPKLAKLFLELGFTRIGVVLDSDKQSVVDELNRLGPEICARVIPAPDIRYKKPVEEEPAVLGLLDNRNRVVRPEYREAAVEALGAVLAHVTPDRPRSVGEG